MNLRRVGNIILFSLALLVPAYGQKDPDPPLAPVFDLLSVQPANGKTELHWIKSTSPDVAGYVIYYFKNGEGFAIDTVFSPAATSYINLSAFANDRIETYVVAAIDSSGNISPLSNALNTVLPSGTADTCKNTISLTWNSYSPVPKILSGYTILISENNEPFNEFTNTEPGITTYTTSEFNPGSDYCFIIKTSFSDGSSSMSGKFCITVNMKRVPGWINADHATVDENGKLSVSFTPDPLSELTTYRLEKKIFGQPGFSVTGDFSVVSGKVTYTDNSADPSKLTWYRLNAINFCSNIVLTSPAISNIAPELWGDNGSAILGWNKPAGWIGTVSIYRIYLDTGNGPELLKTISPPDTSIVIDYNDFMFDVTSGSYCFVVEAEEISNPNGLNGQTRSAKICSDIVEKITVPNAFTPGGDLINDRFRPVLSFTPVDYQLIITDRQNNIIFKSYEFTEEWDGRKNGAVLPPDVFLWFLKVRTPSGKTLSRTGTVTILRGR